MIKIYRIALIIWTLIVLTLLIMPAKAFYHPLRFLTFHHADKLIHFCLFGMLTFLMYKSLPKIIIKRKQLTIIISISAFGFLTECIQGLMYNTSQRSFSIYDWLFDTLAAIFIIAFLFVYEKLTNSTDY